MCADGTDQSCLTCQSRLQDAQAYDHLSAQLIQAAAQLTEVTAGQHPGQADIWHPTGASLVLRALSGQSGACLREIVCDRHFTQLLAGVSTRPAWGGISDRDRRRWARGLR